MANELQTKLDAILLDKNTNLLPKNLKKDITCLGVTGTMESGGGTVEGIKQFSTVEEMQADSTAKEGDLAVVYRSEVQNATVDSKFQVATFPDTVVLDNAITDNVEVRYRAVDSSKMFDCWGSLDNSRFRMDCYTESGEIRIEYRSSDGITYTRTDSTGNPVDFGTEIYYEMPERWNDAIGKFIQCNGNTFEGLYKAESKLTHTVNYNYRLENGEVKYDSVEYDFDQLYEDLRLSHSNGSNLKLVSNYAEGKPTRYWYSAYAGQCLIHYNGHIYFGFATSSDITDNYCVCYRDIGGSDVYPNISTATKVTINSTNYYIFTTSQTVDDISVRYFCDNAGNESYPMYYIENNTVYNIPIVANTGNYYPEWELAPTQLTLNNVNELLPGKIAYGKNGVVTGDGSYVDTIDATTILQILGIDTNNTKNSAICTTNDLLCKNNLICITDDENGTDVYNKVHKRMEITDIGKFNIIRYIDDDKILFVGYTCSSGTAIAYIRVYDIEHNKILTDCEASTSGSSVYLNKCYIKEDDNYLYVICGGLNNVDTYPTTIIATRIDKSDYTYTSKGAYKAGADGNYNAINSLISPCEPVIYNGVLTGIYSEYIGNTKSAYGTYNIDFSTGITFNRLDMSINSDSSANKQCCVMENISVCYIGVTNKGYIITICDGHVIMKSRNGGHSSYIYEVYVQLNKDTNISSIYVTADNIYSVDYTQYCTYNMLTYEMSNLTTISTVEEAQQAYNTGNVIIDQSVSEKYISVSPLHQQNTPNDGAMHTFPKTQINNLLTQTDLTTIIIPDKNNANVLLQSFIIRSERETDEVHWYIYKYLMTNANIKPINSSMSNAYLLASYETYDAYWDSICIRDAETNVIMTNSEEITE